MRGIGVRRHADGECGTPRPGSTSTSVVALRRLTPGRFSHQRPLVLSDGAALWQLAASDAELARGEGDSERDVARAMRRRGHPV